MAKRLFLQENFDYETPDAIIEIDESVIEKTYSSYDNFIKADNGLSDYDVEENEDGTFCIDESDVPSWIEKKINSAWDFSALTSFQKDALIEASNYEIDHSEECDSSTIYEISFNPETGFSFQEDEPAQIGEHYTYWDGHNHKKVLLTSDFHDTFHTEVTDEYPNWEKMESVGGCSWHNGRAVSFHALQNEDNSFTLVQENKSSWQGESNTFQILYGDEAIEALLNHCTTQYVKQYFENILNAQIVTLQEYNPLSTGEKLTWDHDCTLVLTYRGEEYHFNTDQVINLHSAVNDAREAIRTRRIKAITEKLAANNYEGVLTLPLQKIYVERDDSITAGNCQEYTDELIFTICKKEGIQGNFALRADRLLEYRDDNYSRRAVLQAYRAGHMVHASA